MCLFGSMASIIQNSRRPDVGTVHSLGAGTYGDGTVPEGKGLGKRVQPGDAHAGARGPRGDVPRRNSVWLERGGWWAGCPSG